MNGGSGLRRVSQYNVIHIKAYSPMKPHLYISVVLTTLLLE